MKLMNYTVVKVNTSKEPSKLTENADEGVSSEKIYSTALHESLEYQRNFLLRIRKSSLYS